MEFRDYARVLRRYWVLLLAAMLVGAGVGGFVTSRIPDTYQATAKSFIAVRTGNSVLDLAQGGTYVQQIVASYAQIATTQYVLTEVRQRLGLKTSTAALANQITASAPPDTAIIQVTATASSARQAADIANATSDELSTAVSRLSSQSRTVSVTQVQIATPPVSASSPSLWLDIALGLIGGLLIAVVVIAIREALNTRIRDTRDVEQIIGTTVLGSVPADGALRGRSPISVATSTIGRVPEAYRRVRAMLENTDGSGEARMWTVTSATGGEGRTMSAISLAIAQSQLGDRVLLVDADFRAPTLSRIFDLAGKPGLWDVLTERVTLADAIHRHGDGGLQILPAGSALDLRPEVLQTKAARVLLARLREGFDAVVIDAPPILEAAEASAIVRASHQIVVIVAVGRLNADELQSALVQLEQINTAIAGVIATFAPRHDGRANGSPRYRSRRRRVPTTAVVSSADVAGVGGADGGVAADVRPDSMELDNVGRP